MQPEAAKQAVSAGLRYHQAGLLGQAETIYREVLRHYPRNHAALHFLGVLLYQRGALDEAERLVGRAVQIAGGDPDYLCNHGVVLQALGRVDEAERTYRRALARGAGNSADVLSNLGSLLHRRGAFDEAQAHLEKAVRLAPNHATAAMNLGNLHRVRGNLAEAERLHAHAARLVPASPEAHVNLGTTLQDLGRWPAAERSYRRAILLAPTLAAAYGNLGSLLSDDGRAEAASRTLRAGLALDPGNAGAWGGLAMSEFVTGGAERALAPSWRAVLLDPGDPRVGYNHGEVLLAAGDRRRGWRFNECRLGKVDAVVRHGLPRRWAGEPLAGRRLVICAEQGIGDELMYAACFPDAIAAAGRCYIECDQRLVPLFARSFAAATVHHYLRAGDLAPKHQVYTWIPGDAPAELSIEAGSLMRYFRQGSGSDPADGGYLVPQPALAHHWESRLAARGGALRVGLAWRSLNAESGRLPHYTQLAAWAPLLALPGILPVCLQAGDCAAEVADVERRLGVSLARWDDLDLKDDFDGVAALMSRLDVVVSPLSTPTWLAAGLGRPVLAPMLRPYRMMLGTDRIPSHPTIRPYVKWRHEPWDPVIAAIARSVSERAGIG